MKFTEQTAEEYHNNGYVIVRNFFSKEETDLIYKLAVHDDAISKNSLDRSDASGRKTRLTLWYSTDDGIYSKFTRSERIINAVEKLLGGQVAHYHTKIMQKEPKVGGAWEWHQDYGYWYKNGGFLFPQMLSVLTALTVSNKENGCLQMIKGSHKMGRIEHGLTGEQAGADMERVTEALKIMPLDYLEMNPGDTAFFHSNTLHASAANLSDKSRWSIITAYNLASNKPYKNIHESSYKPVKPYTKDLLKEKIEKMSDQVDFLNI